MDMRIQERRLAGAQAYRYIPPQEERPIGSCPMCGAPIYAGDRVETCTKTGEVLHCMECVTERDAGDVMMDGI